MPHTRLGKNTAIRQRAASRSQQHIPGCPGGKAETTQKQMEPTVRGSQAPLAETMVLRATSAFLVAYATVGWTLPEMTVPRAQFLLRLCQSCFMLIAVTSVGICVLYAKIHARVADSARWMLDVAASGSTPGWHAQALVHSGVIQIPLVVYLVLSVPLLVPSSVILLTVILTPYESEDYSQHLWSIFSLLLALAEGFVVVICFVRRTWRLEQLNPLTLLKSPGFVDPEHYVRISKALSHDHIRAGPFVHLPMAGT